MSNIAFIGLGNMGSHMCANLTNAGHQVAAFDLNPQSIADAQTAGARAADNVGDCVANAQFVITMLPAGKNVHSVYFDADGVTANAPASALLIDCSTIAVDEARSIAEQAKALGFSTGRPGFWRRRSRQGGTLTFMVGGDAADFAGAARCCRIWGRTFSTLARLVTAKRQRRRTTCCWNIHDRYVRGIQLGGKTWTGCADILRHFIQSLRPMLVDDELCPAPGQYPPPQPTTITSRGLRWR